AEPEPVPVVEQSAVSDADNLWHAWLPRLQLTGMAQQLAEHCLLEAETEREVILALDSSGTSLLTRRTEESLQVALGTYLQREVAVKFQGRDQLQDTPEQRRIRLDKERQAQAEQAIADDPFVQQLQQQWGAVIIPGSVRPIRDTESK
ncbi:MAG: DNA polymerase III subunit gamma/tau C-terminal domain-containing protein, partial [Thiolinea sp.]